MNLLKIKKNWETLLVPKTLQRKKKYSEPCFQLLRKNELGQIEKSQQVYLGEKEEEMISTIRNTVNHDDKNLGLVPVLEPYSDKDATMMKELSCVEKKFKLRLNRF